MGVKTAALVFFTVAICGFLINDLVMRQSQGDHRHIRLNNIASQVRRSSRLLPHLISSHLSLFPYIYLHIYLNTNNYELLPSHKDSTDSVSYADIDVVYTWVNGSDPVWLSKKNYWSRMMLPVDDSIDTVDSARIGVNINSTGDSSTNMDSTISNDTAVNTTTMFSLNATNTMGNSSHQEDDDRMSSNRYRDSDELKYSLRSLVRYAPWIRNIYIVTDNQIPKWLNVEHPRIHMVSHSEIFPNKSHLPVFSSPAIETHLHRIPGLSKRFIYFNDDVFLGSNVRPDDFFALDMSQKLRFAWDVPKCAPGCSDSWIGDGFCDKACNVSACNFDFPDCINGTKRNPGSRSNRNGEAGGQHVAVCSKGCPTNWLADRVCDVRCDKLECAWDMGDCGLDRMMGSFPSAELPRESLVLVAPDNNTTSLDTAPLLLIAPKSQTTAFHINVSEAVQALSMSRDVVFEDVSFTEYHGNTTGPLIEVAVDEGLVHIVTVSKQLGLVTVLLLNEEDASRWSWPVDIYFTVKVEYISTVSSLFNPLINFVFSMFSQ